MLYQNHEEHHGGYIVPLSYSGQQGANIQALISLQCWMSSFKLPMRILEPVLSNTMFYSVPHDTNDTSLTFSDLFDIQHFNRMSESFGYPLMATREQFFSDAPKEAILMMKAPNGAPPSVIWAADSEIDGKGSCYQDIKQSSDAMKLIKEYGLCFVRIVRAPYNHKRSSLSDEEFREIIFGNLLPQHVSLVFYLWNTRWYAQNNSSDFETPPLCRGVGKTSIKRQFLPSPRLLSDANYYEKHFLNSSNDVALMFRIERMMQYIKEHQRESSISVNSCLDEAVRVAKGKRKFGYPLVAIDLGTFGSSSLLHFLGKNMEPLIRKSKVLLTDLYDNKLTFDEWEMSFVKATGGVENSGYIAALQRTLASRAKCLVLVGGGNFQDLALKDYLKNHPNKEDQCVHLVCALMEKRFSENMENNT